MHIASARVTSKGQITLPSKLRKELGLGTGSTVDFERLPDGKVQIVPKSRSMGDIRGMVKTDRVLDSEQLATAIRSAMGGRWARHAEDDEAEHDDRP